VRPRWPACAWHSPWRLSAATGWCAGQRLAQVLPAELAGVDLQLTGVIVELPQPGPQGTPFVLRVEQVRRATASR